jgi:flagellar biosynthetic protein FlhB
MRRNCWYDMADKGTEAGTPQRKKKARDQGDRVRSRELLSAVAMVCGVVTLGVVADLFPKLWRVMFERSLAAALVRQDTGDLHWDATIRSLIALAATPMALVMLASYLGALGVGIAQSGGLSFNMESIAPKFSKLNPLTNFSNLFSLRSATRVAKSLAPALVMVWLGWQALRDLMVPMPVLSMTRLPVALGMVYKLGLDAALVTLLWSGLDYIVEYVAWNKRMKMTKQQMRDEHKETQGSPEVKGRLRRMQMQLQRAMRKRRVKADMSRASVVITNPTHYAVALEFSFESMGAPTVLAKGRDLHAAEIREAARWAGVPMIENPPLARSLYRMVEPGQTIPFELYAAVAAILAFLYRQKVAEQMQRKRESERLAVVRA